MAAGFLGTFWLSFSSHDSTVLAASSSMRPFTSRTATALTSFGALPDCAGTLSTEQRTLAGAGGGAAGGGVIGVVAVAAGFSSLINASDGCPHDRSKQNEQRAYLRG